MSKPEFVYQTFIRASAERVWQGITDPEFTRQYFHATRITSTFEEGASVQYINGDGSAAVEGQVVTARRAEELVITWHVLYDEDAAREAPSRVRFLLEDLGGQTRLTIVHDSFPEPTVVYPSISEGWPWILAGLKSLLETGEALPPLAGS
ncbi:MAG: SRPBCC family protein [Gammaproteobacteria bacterium]|nr:SRPBCC family protein [Gammaproteobacteria bacterium]